MKNRYAVKWLYQRVSAVFLAILLWVHIHYIIKNIITRETDTYADFISLVSHPWIKILEIAFFFFALSHGLTGIDSVLDNYRLFGSLKKVISRCLWLVGGFLFLGIVILIIQV